MANQFNNQSQIKLSNRNISGDIKGLVKNKKFYIGIDSGGTKCEFMIADENMNVLFYKKFKSIHYSVVGAEKISDEFSSLIKKNLKLKKLDLKNCGGICIGLAGAREDNDRKILFNKFSKKLGFKKIRIETDTMTGLYGAIGSGNGVILISGTGSVLFGKYGKNFFRVGGWGRILGDEGSGFWIGRMGLNLAVKEYDLMKKNKSDLTKRLKKEFNLDDKNILEEVFHKNFPVQHIAPLVIELSKRDKQCKKIIEDAVDALYGLVDTFVKISKLKTKTELAFIGSIIESKNILSDRLKNKIKNNFKNINLITKRNIPVYGAILLAKEL